VHETEFRMSQLASSCLGLYRMSLVGCSRYRRASLSLSQACHVLLLYIFSTRQHNYILARYIIFYMLPPAPVRLSVRHRGGSLDQSKTVEVRIIIGAYRYIRFPDGTPDVSDVRYVCLLSDDDARLKIG